MSQQIGNASKKKPQNGIRHFTIGRFLLLVLLVLAALFTTGGTGHSLSVADEACDCSSCHGTGPHGPNWNGCSGCHDTPPQTGTHLVHYNSAPVTVMGYGDTGVSSTDQVYRFGCGNCHPLDFTRHNNGTVDIELYDPNAPAGSIKAANPPNASYAPGPIRTTYDSKVSGGNSFSYSDGTCSNIYCHSGYTVSSGAVGLPTGKDQYGNPTYDPYPVAYSRVYKTTPPWGTTGSFTTCTECHDFPLTTSYPSVQAGVGDSHQWIDDYGYGNLHAYNMGFDPISCRTCHYGIVTQANTWSRNSMDITTYNSVPLASRQLHVNGQPSVVFDTTNPVIYPTSSGTATFNLSGASFDPAAKTCSNVACHLQQTRVTWGSPYRWWLEPVECDVCHRMSY
jgi:predicted CxxxxCH...CXXCH cytochrome family protein